MGKAIRAGKVSLSLGLHLCPTSDGQHISIFEALGGDRNLVRIRIISLVVVIYSFQPNPTRHSAWNVHTCGIKPNESDFDGAIQKRICCPIWAEPASTGSFALALCIKPPCQVVCNALGARVPIVINFDQDENRDRLRLRVCGPCEGFGDWDINSIHDLCDDMIISFSYNTWSIKSFVGHRFTSS